MSRLCLAELLHLYIHRNDTCDNVNELIVYMLYDVRKSLKAVELRSYLYEFVESGFNPFSPDLSDTAKIMMKSIIAKCDSIL